MTYNQYCSSDLKVAKRINLKSSHGKKKICNFVWQQMVTRLIMVTIFKRIKILNHYVIYLNNVMVVVEVVI